MEEHLEGTYVKLKEIEQNDAGDYFAAAYYDAGVFKIRTFGAAAAYMRLLRVRSDEDILREELNVN